MANIYDTFGIDVDLAENGVWITEIAGNEEFLVASYSNAKHKAVLESWMKKNERRLKNGSLTDADASNFLIKSFTKYVLLNWKNVTDRQGNPLEYTPEAAFELLNHPAMRPLLELLESLSKEEASFREEIKKESAKNLRKQSAGN